MVALQPAVTTTKSGSKEADAFTGTSHCQSVNDGQIVFYELLTRLFTSSPERICHLLRVNTATDSNSLAILSNGKAVQLRQVNLDAIVHSAQGCERSVVAIVSKNGNLVLGSKFHLRDASQRLEGLAGVRTIDEDLITYNLCDILLSARGNDHVWRRWLQIGPPDSESGEL